MQKGRQLATAPGVAHWEVPLSLAFFSVFAVVMFLTSPTGGDFHWSDAPRHALNGIFVHDLLVAQPFGDPKGWAVNYYLQYPALTILFYPPLFSGVLAASYSMFGFSHETAQGSVAFFHLLLGFSVFLLARRWMPFGYALGAGLMLAAAPEIAQWGRQVMLDIPAYAWLGFMAVFFVRYLDDQHPKDWYLALICYLLALYTKQTPLFIAGALFVGLILARGLSMFKDRHLWIGGGLFFIGLLPLIVMHLQFGQVNTASMMGSERSDIPRLSIEAWAYYLSVLPQQLGWPTLILALLYLLGAAVRVDWRLPRWHMGFLITWFVFGYLMFSFIMVREPRHDLMALLPFPVFAALGLYKLFTDKWSSEILGPALAVGVGLSSLLWSVYTYPVKYIKGYREAAQYVMEHAPPDSVVMFHGYRDGSFIFNMRVGDRPDLSIARSDKFLIRVAIERIRGVEDRGFSTAGVEQLFQRHGIRYVVAQPGFWADLPSFMVLEQLLADGSKFKKIHQIQTEANHNHSDSEIAIYRYLGELQSPPQPMTVEMVGIGQTFEQR